MINVKEAQDLTYKDSKWAQKLEKKIDRKIKRAINRGRSSVFINVPQFSGDINVFLSIANKYRNTGYAVQEYSTREEGTIFFWGVWISWEK